jgi:hypothetical protein
MLSLQADLAPLYVRGQARPFLHTLHTRHSMHAQRGSDYYGKHACPGVGRSHGVFDEMPFCRTRGAQQITVLVRQPGPQLHSVRGDGGHLRYKHTNDLQRRHRFANQVLGCVHAPGQEASFLSLGPEPPRSLQTRWMSVN